MDISCSQVGILCWKILRGRKGIWAFLWELQDQRAFLPYVSHDRLQSKVEGKHIYTCRETSPEIMFLQPTSGFSWSLYSYEGQLLPVTYWLLFVEIKWNIDKHHLSNEDIEAVMWASSTYDVESWKEGSFYPNKKRADNIKNDDFSWTHQWVEVARKPSILKSEERKVPPREHWPTCSRAQEEDEASMTWIRWIQVKVLANC